MQEVSAGQALFVKGKMGRLTKKYSNRYNLKQQAFTSYNKHVLILDLATRQQHTVQK
jgi:hypothetical protein